MIIENRTFYQILDSKDTIYLEIIGTNNYPLTVDMMGVYESGKIPLSIDEYGCIGTNEIIFPNIGKQYEYIFLHITLLSYILLKWGRHCNLVGTSQIKQPTKI